MVKRQSIVKATTKFTARTIVNRTINDKLGSQSIVGAVLKTLFSKSIQTITKEKKTSSRPSMIDLKTFTTANKTKNKDFAKSMNGK